MQAEAAAPRLEPLHSLDSDADDLAWMWLDTRLDHATVQRRAQRLVDQADARGERHTGELSAAFEALRLAVFSVPDSSTLARVDKLLQTVWDSACERARRVAQAAWVHARWTELQLAPPQVRAQALLRLGPPDSAPEPMAPAAEAFWTEVARCALHNANGTRDEACASGLRAQVLAQDVGNDFMQALAALRRAQTFIDDADADTATALLDQAVAAARACGPLPTALYLELLLALLWAGPPRQPGLWVDTQPALLNPVLLQRTPQLAAAVGLARCWQGRHDEAQALLNTVPALGSGHALPAVQVWAVAAAHLQLGQPAQARSLVEQSLAWLQAPGQQPLPPHIARLYLLLGQACEAQRDSVGAQRLLAAAPAAAAAGQAPAASRSRFLAHVVHEVRNGVFGVQGPLSLALMAELAPEQRRTLDLAQRSTELLLTLCNDLLDLARVDARRFTLRLQPTALGPLLVDTVQSLQPAALARRLQLRLNPFDPLPARLLCDSARVQQVLLNLVGNALKFTRHGTVTVQVHWQPAPAAQAQTQGELAVSVVDTGPGLSPQSCQQLFKDFAQLLEPDHGPEEAAIADTDLGLGLGLAISHALVQQMGGRMGVDSHPGQGSRFWFSLTLQQA